MLMVDLLFLVSSTFIMVGSLYYNRRVVGNRMASERALVPLLCCLAFAAISLSSTIRAFSRRPVSAEELLPLALSAAMLLAASALMLATWRFLRSPDADIVDGQVMRR